MGVCVFARACVGVCSLAVIMLNAVVEMDINEREGGLFGWVFILLSQC